MLSTPFTPSRIPFSRRFAPILVAASIAAAGCETTTLEDRIDYRVEDAKTSSVLDSRLKTLVEKVKEYPRRDDLHYEIASVYFKKGDLRSSADAIERAIDLAPDEAKYYYQLGRLRMAMKELNKAEKCFREAVRLFPDRLPAPYAALGNVLAQKRDITGAIAEFEKCLELDPDNSMYYYILGCLHDMRGETEETIHAFQEYLVRGGTVYKKRALYLLEKLGVAVEQLPPARITGGKDRAITGPANAWEDGPGGLEPGGADATKSVSATPEPVAPTAAKDSGGAE
jgi:tetratricopeptide (TPR) repeat protein